MNQADHLLPLQYFLLIYFLIIYVILNNIYLSVYLTPSIWIVRYFTNYVISA